jgi:hypothetical protein
MLSAQGLWAGRDLYHATPAVTQGLDFSVLIRRTAQFSRLLRHAWRRGGPILTWIHPHGECVCDLLQKCGMYKITNRCRCYTPSLWKVVCTCISITTEKIIFVPGLHSKGVLDLSLQTISRWGHFCLCKITCANCWRCHKILKTSILEWCCQQGFGRKNHLQFRQILEENWE